jgi:Coenzyme PQQ synthesis protein D (PqqD)
MRASPSGLSAIDPLGVTPLPRPNPAVVFCEVQEGAVLLSTEEEAYYGLNAVGARVWSLLPPIRKTLQDLCTALKEEYPDVDPESLRVDVIALLEDLVSARLVVPL